ncbi:MAG: tetratricopeptide repeat protein, partial [Desulfobulbaceae bacterium]|nr:tetratricopeptide repeat protein [Desulfobulbaceae bacterium]
MPPPVVVTPALLWEQATAARDADKSMDAAVLFQRLQDQFPTDEHAEEALWQAAQQAKLNASIVRDPNWRYVRDLFKRYTVDYPKSPRYPEAYFEGAVAHFNMKLFREALIYFNLFLKRFPDSPLAQQARYWQGQTFLKVDRLADATKVFEELSHAKDRTLRLQGFVGLGDALFAGEQYLAALAAYKKVFSKSPDYYFEDPSLLVKLGKTYFKVGNEAQGMKRLFHYLNLDKTSRQRADVLFELGESYHRQGDVDASQRMYGMAEEEGVKDSRPFVLSRFRQAQYRDDPKRVIPDWKKPTDLSDPAGDAPYLDVLDLFYRDPVAQEARLALIRRYQARKDNLRLFEVAVNFIQHAPEGPLRQEMQAVVGDILVARVQDDLAGERYQDVYDLYRADHQHVAAYRQGRLLYLIGQAF